MRQATNLDMTKRQLWTEADIDALPLGEHDYFERKSGQLFSDTGALLGKLAKTISALANSGGGSIILGVADDGTPDGVPPKQGNTSIKDWLEQKIPYLVSYPLSDFRVHLVVKSPTTRVGAGSEVVVIDIGDSALAPHQCAHGGGGATKHTYYYRQAGRSEPAPHFYLELLRQRLVSPTIVVPACDVVPVNAGRTDSAIFLAVSLRFRLKNTGRVAAYKWNLLVKKQSGHPEDRFSDYMFRQQDFPLEFRSSRGGIRLDDTILPDCEMLEELSWGVMLRPRHDTRAAIQDEIGSMILPVLLTYRIATETSPGQEESIILRDKLAEVDLLGFIAERVLRDNA